MKHLLFVCLIAFALTNTAVAQAPANTEGVNVQMAASNHAVAFPAADQPDAWVITITADGRLFFGVKPVSEASLAEEMKTTPRNRAARIYIKADARASLRAVGQALHAAHEVFFESAVLLTEPTQPAAEGPIVPPQGLEVRLGLASSPATVVEIHNSGRPIPAVKVNDREIPWQALQNALEQASQNQSEKLVVVEADPSLPFAQVLRVIDLSRAVTAQVAVSLTGL